MKNNFRIITKKGKYYPQQKTWYGRWSYIYGIHPGGFYKEDFNTLQGAIKYIDAFIKKEEIKKEINGQIFSYNNQLKEWRPIW